MIYIVIYYLSVTAFANWTNMFSSCLMFNVQKKRELNTLLNKNVFPTLVIFCIYIISLYTF